MSMKKNIILFPECWEDVRQREWEYLLSLRVKIAVTPGIELKDVKRAWCRYVLKERGCRMSSAQAYILCNQLSKTLDWMWRENPGNGTVELTYDSTVNLLPRWKGLLGPASHGADLTFGEFRVAVQMMNAYTTTHERIYLYRLAGMLYRPVVKGKKEPFSISRMDVYQERLKKMPESLLWGVYAWFASFCNYLFSGIFILDGMEVCFSPLFEAGKSEGPSLGMNSVLFSIAESGIFGNVDEVDNTQLMRVLMKLLDDKQKADNLLKQMKK